MRRSFLVVTVSRAGLHDDDARNASTHAHPSLEPLNYGAIFDLTPISSARVSVAEMTCRSASARLPSANIHTYTALIAAVVA